MLLKAGLAIWKLLSLLAEMKPEVVVSFIWTGLEGVTGAEGGTLREEEGRGDSFEEGE